MKKKFLCIAALFSCLSIIAGGTHAYYTATDTARNVITSGGVDIEILEQQLVDGTLQPYPEQPIAMMPNTAVSKIVSVQSIDESAWVRMNYHLTVYDREGRKMEIPAQEQEKMIVITPDTTNWTWKDGWWYYNTALKTGETTKPLFEEISFSGKDMGNQYQLCTVQVYVNAQAVQTANNGDSVLKALGWPEN